MSEVRQLDQLLKLMFKPHPWHGISAGDDVPNLVNAYIELGPTDTVKYEIDKVSGHLLMDRPQKYSNHCPALYGFIPQTYCGKRVGDYCMLKTGKTGIKGDGDPLDICILSERVVNHANLLLKVVPIGGLRMLDGDEADDKIIAVLRNDAVYSKYKNITDCPSTLIDRLNHYFLTYKDLPKSTRSSTEITHIYNRDEAVQVIEASLKDYKEVYGDVSSLGESLVNAIKNAMN